MMREYKSYEEYKDSGIKIIGDIPREWNLNKIKYNNIINPNKSELSYKKIDVSFIPMEYIKDGFIENKDIKNIDEVYNGYTYFKEGDILLAKVTPCFENGNLGIAKDLKNGIGFGTTEVHVIRAKKDNKKFIYYLFQNKHFKEKGNSEMYGAGGLKRIPSDFVENYIYPRPDYQTQICISNYLDQKTAKIDEIINKKEKLIDNLEKYKKSVITEAVTKGKLGDKYLSEDGELVDEIEMKDSGVEWIGEIPEYWEVSKIKYICKKIKTGSTPSTSKEKYFEGNINWITPVDFKDNFIIKNSERKLSKIAIKEGEAPYFKNITLIIGIGATTGKVSHVYMNTSFNQQVTGLITNKRLLNQYYFSLSLSNFKETLRNIALYTTLPIINNETLSNFIIPYPNKDIQTKITNFINQKFSEINNLIKKTKKSIEKYKEYKKSLIFEAVTGKIDLRDYELEGGEKLAEHNNSSEIERECLSAVD